MFCPNCHSDFVEGITECSECGVPLVDQLPDNTPRPRTIDPPPNHPSEYLNDLNEWSNNMYNPGHWVGGNIPPHINFLIKAGNLPIGIVAFVLGIGLLVFVGISLAQADWNNPEELLGLIPSSILAVFFGVVLVAISSYRNQAGDVGILTYQNFNKFL